MKIELAAKPTVHEKSVHVDRMVSDETWKEASQDVVKDRAPTPAERRRQPPTETLQ